MPITRQARESSGGHHASSSDVCPLASRLVRFRPEPLDTLQVALSASLLVVVDGWAAPRGWGVEVIDREDSEKMPHRQTRTDIPSHQTIQSLSNPEIITLAAFSFVLKSWTKCR